MWIVVARAGHLFTKYAVVRENTYQRYGVYLMRRSSFPLMVSTALSRQNTHERNLLPQPWLYKAFDADHCVALTPGRRPSVPILSEQPSHYPEDLLHEDFSGHPGRQWWVLYTKVRQEKAIARQLLTLRTPFYLPLVWKRSVARCVIRSQIPLFPGYVFLYGSEEERVSSLATNRIVRILAVATPERLREDLSRLRRLIDSGAGVTLESRLEPGIRVRVRHGPFVGIEGTVLTRRGETRLLVAVDFLQQGASIEIDDAVLEPVD